MAEVDAQQKASDACGGRVSHERGGGGRGDRMCQDQSIVHAGLLFSPVPPPRYFSFSSTFLFFSFITVFLVIAFLQSIVTTSNLNLNHVLPRETRDLMLVTCIDLYFTSVIIFGSSSFDLCNIVVLLFVTDV